MDTDILIIGGGAAGLMAAYAAAASAGSPKVIVLEKMPRPARKIMITGKGRCNYTNMKSWDAFAEHIRTDRNFIRPAFFNLKPEALQAFFEAHGLESVVERGDRAYPATYKASDIVDTLCKAAIGQGAVIECGKEVREIKRNEEEPRFTVRCSDGKEYNSRALIIATGGLSYPTTGSTGDGYIFAEDLGHNVKTCFPALTAMVPFGYKQCPERLPKGALKGHIDREIPLSELGEKLCGVNLKNVTASLYNGDSMLQSEMGELSFTDCGIEGPIGFSLSRNCVKGVMNGAKVRVVLDLKPGVETAQLKGRITALIDECKGCKAEVLRKLLPAELIQGFIDWNPTLQGAELKPDALVKALKEWTFNIAGYVGYERCVVTAGGVNTREIIPKSMQSRLCPGLFFCGEVIDIDCDTGGYNLQCAFCTGYLAGQSAAKLK